VVVYQGKTVVYRQFTYLMLNKPDGYLSATEDSRDPTVLDLLPLSFAASICSPAGGSTRTRWVFCF
jgi:16S rRNA pseudouridine516 synthase